MDQWEEVRGITWQGLSIISWLGSCGNDERWVWCQPPLQRPLYTLPYTRGALLGEDTIHSSYEEISYTLCMWRISHASKDAWLRVWCSTFITCLLICHELGLPDFVVLTTLWMNLLIRAKRLLYTKSKGAECWKLGGRLIGMQLYCTYWYYVRRAKLTKRSSPNRYSLENNYYILSLNYILETGFRRPCAAHESGRLQQAAKVRLYLELSQLRTGGRPPDPQ